MVRIKECKNVMEVLRKAINQEKLHAGGVI